MEMFTHMRKTPAAVTLILLTALIVGFASSARAQIDYEEIVVSLDVPRLVNADIFVQYDGTTIYLPVIEIFNLLEINTVHSPAARKIYGYFITKDKEYEIDIENGRVKTFLGEFELPREAYFYEGHEFFLRIDFFGEYFGLQAIFEFTQMKISLPLNRDFPAFQRLERKKAQEKLLADKTDDINIYPLPFKRAWLEGGVADWMIATNPVGRRKVHYFSLTTGSMLLGGDLDVTGTGNTQNGFDANDIRYKWHYFVNDNPYLSQIEAGNVYAGGRLPRSVEGASFTNKPQIRRKFFQTINLSDYIGQDWEVELYIDNRLVDFTRTNESGRYNFNVDIYYGASLITLKKYGPNGEIKIEEQNVKVPYNLIPKQEFEYTAAIGRDDNLYTGGLYGQANCYYGFTSRITAGLNFDVPLSTDSSDGLMGALDLAIQPLTNLTINGYAAPNHAINAGVNFSQPNIINFNATATHYLGRSFRNLAGRLNSFALSMSSPLKIGRKRISLRCNTFVDFFDKGTEVNTYYGFSSSFRQFYINYFGKYNISQYNDNRPSMSAISSQILFSTSIVRWIRPQFSVDYNHTAKELMRYGVSVTKRIFKTGQISFAYERNVPAQSTLMTLTLTLYSDFATFSSRGMKSGDQTSVTQTQRGSVRYNQELHTLHFDRRSGVGQGSAVLRPFVDNNYNGKFDAGDRPVVGLTAKIKGSSGKLTSDGKKFYFDRLRAYDEYVIQINEYSLDNPLLRPVHEGYRMNFNPNMVTAIDIPIVVAGEVSGIVSRKTSKGQAGLGGAKLVFINLSSGTKTEIQTFNNGEFYYLGLIPGKYRAQLDKFQMDSYGYVSSPEYIDFEVESSDTGAVVENIDFMVVPR